MFLTVQEQENTKSPKVELSNQALCASNGSFFCTSKQLHNTDTNTVCIQGDRHMMTLTRTLAQELRGDRMGACGGIV